MFRVVFRVRVLPSAKACANISTERQQVINLFPLEEVEVPETTSEPMDEVFEAWCGYHSRARPNLPSTPTPEDEPDEKRSKKILEPGEGYRVYDWRRPQDVPRDLSLLITVVSEIVGLDQREVLKELYAFELLLQAANGKIRRRTQVRRRKNRGSDDGEARTTDGDDTSTDRGAGTTHGDADGRSKTLPRRRKKRKSGDVKVVTPDGDAVSVDGGGGSSDGDADGESDA
jgi:hypothetical protein